MGFLDSAMGTMKAWFHREAAEARDLSDDLARRLDADLDRREAEMAATPIERFEQIQDRIDTESSFDEVKADIEARAAAQEGMNESGAGERLARIRREVTGEGPPDDSSADTADGPDGDTHGTADADIEDAVIVDDRFEDDGPHQPPST